MANDAERNDRFAEGEYSLEGYQAYDVHYEKVGKVDDLFVDEEDDRPRYIAVKTGLLGTSSTLIPLEIVRINDKRELVEIEAEKETIKEGPSFSDDREITTDFLRRVLDHYRTAITRASSERDVDVARSADAGDDRRVDLRPGERAAQAREHAGEDHIAGGMRGDRDRERAAQARGHSGEEHIGEMRGGRDRERGGEIRSEDEIRVQRSEEELRAGTREREAGGVRVRKQVRTDRERVAVPKKREEVHVERVPVEEGATTEVEIGDDEIRVPVIEEEIVVEKRPVVKEEIRLRKEVVEEEEIVEEEVRKEEVDIDDQTKRRDR